MVNGKDVWIGCQCILECGEPPECSVEVWYWGNELISYPARVQFTNVRQSNETLPGP